MHEIKRFWDRIRTEAGIVDVRIHDLRHTFASLLVSGGMLLPMIGRLLGHTQVQTTQRYAHLFDDPLRAGLQQVDQLMRRKLKLVDTARAAERTPSFGVWGVKPPIPPPCGDCGTFSLRHAPRSWQWENAIPEGGVFLNK